jgi:hypothetical protein
MGGLTSSTTSPALLMDSTAVPSAVKVQAAAMPACRRRPHSGCSAPSPAAHTRTWSVDSAPGHLALLSLSKDPECRFTIGRCV